MSCAVMLDITTRHEPKLEAAGRPLPFFPMEGGPAAGRVALGPACPPGCLAGPLGTKRNSNFHKGNEEDQAAPNKICSRSPLHRSEARAPREDHAGRLASVGRS